MVRPVSELRRNCVSLLDNFGQTMGVLSPAGTISVIIPLLILSAGNGTWLLLLVTLAIFLIVMLAVLRFAALHSSAGSLAAFTRLGFGVRGGLIAAWIYLLGIGFCIPAAVLTAAAYIDMLLVPWLGPPATPLRISAITALLTLGCWAAAFHGIRFSTHLMLLIECLSVTLMTVLVLAGMFHAHAWVDRPQLHLTGVHFSGLQGGLVLAFMLMAGFEGATSLGEESKDATESIPTAIGSCMLPLTAVYLLMTYCIVSLENRGVVAGEVDGLTVPFDNIAHALGVPWLGALSSLGVAMSYFACALGSLTVAARVLFSMARDGRFFPAFGAVHPRNATPARSIGLIGLISMMVPIGVLVAGGSVSSGITFISQLGSIGLIGGYLAVVLALPIYLRRRGLLETRDLATCGLAGAMLSLVLVLSVYPVPAPPYVYVVYIFGACALAGIALSTLSMARHSRTQESGEFS
jgi:amino acid transporter